MPDVTLAVECNTIRTFYHATTPTPLLNTLMGVHAGDTLLYGGSTLKVLDRVVDLDTHHVTLLLQAQ